MSKKRDKRIDGEYDRPLPERIIRPTEKDKERLKKLIERYPGLKSSGQKEANPKV